MKKGDELKINNYSNYSFTNSSIKVNSPHFKNNQIEVYKGPEFDQLSTKTQSLLLNRIFSISNNNNRMGYQLNELIETTKMEPMLSSIVIPGTVQLTPSGKLIVLMRDCQTTGGYPRVFQLNNDSINRLAQKTTNDKIQFRLIDPINYI